MQKVDIVVEAETANIEPVGYRTVKIELGNVSIDEIIEAIGIKEILAEIGDSDIVANVGNTDGLLDEIGEEEARKFFDIPKEG